MSIVRLDASTVVAIVVVVVAVVVVFVVFVDEDLSDVFPFDLAVTRSNQRGVGDE